MPATEQQIRQYVDSKLSAANLTQEELNAFYALARGRGMAGQNTGNYGVNLQNAMAKLGFKNSNEFLNFAKGASSLYGKASWDEGAQYLGLNPDGSDPNALQPVDPDKAAADKLAADLDAFGREMMGPLNMSDPTVKRLIESAQAGISRDVLGSGVEGGMANAAIGKGVGDAGLAIHAQRQALGAQVLGNRLVDQRQLNMYKDQAARMQLGEEYQNQLAGWESSRGMGQQIGGLLGAAVGGVGGFFLGGPAGAAMGASGGYGIGSGIGGSTSGGPPRAPVYNSPYYGYSSGGMSGGGRMGY